MSTDTSRLDSAPEPPSLPPNRSPDQRVRFDRFVRNNFRFLGFGFTLIFLSSFGQTYYIGMFGPEIRAAFGLSNGDFGAVYTLATLASAAVIIWSGSLIDRYDLRIYVVGVAVSYILAHIVMGFAASVLWLGVALFLLRQAGQGLMVHTSQSTIARYFSRDRGRALSLVTLGIPAGEAVFPLVAVSLIAWVGWQLSWIASAIFLAVFLVPFALWLLKGHGERHQALMAAQQRAGQVGGADDQSRAEVMRDANFYLMAAPFLLITFLVTGLFFHQGVVAGARDWDLTLVAQAFIAYSAVKAVTTLATGQMIDRFGATRLVPLFLLPMALALVVLAMFDSTVAAFGYFSLAGVSAGAGQTLNSAVWAEIYGVRHIGAIRSMVTSLWVAASALSTWGMGYLFDIGVTIAQTAMMSIGLIAVASAAAAVGVIRLRRARVGA